MSVKIALLTIVFLVLIAGCSDNTPTAPAQQGTAPTVNQTLVEVDELSAIVASAGDNYFLGIDNHLWRVVYYEEPIGHPAWRYEQKCALPIPLTSLKFIQRGGSYFWIVSDMGRLWRGTVDGGWLDAGELPLQVTDRRSHTELDGGTP